MPTSTRINPAFRADVGIRPYDYDALNNHLSFYHSLNEWSVHGGRYTV